VLSAEGKMSAWVLSLLPFIVGTLMMFVNPSFMEVLWTDPTGLKMIVGGLVSMAVGVLWMSRIVALRV
jgi:tight adherence protein B